MNFRKYLSQILLESDIFGTTFSFPITSDSIYLKTKLGGFYSLLIITLALSYSLLNFQFWFSNQISPIIVNFSLKREAPLLTNISENQISLSFVTTRSFFQDEKKIYFIPKIVLWSPPNNYTNSSIKLKKQINENKNNMTFILMNQIQVYQDTVNLNTFVIYIYKCHENWLLEGEYCASDEELDDLFKSDFTLIFTFKFQRFNFYTLESEQYEKSNYFYLDKKFYLQTLVNLQYHHLKYDAGLYPFSSNKQLSFISGYQLSNSVISSENSIYKTPFNLPGYGEFFFQFDNDNQITKISKMRLLDLFIISFSLFKFLQSLSFQLFFQRNQRIMKQHLIKKLPTNQHFSSQQEQKLLYDQIISLDNLLNILSNKITKEKQFNSQESQNYEQRQNNNINQENQEISNLGSQINKYYQDQSRLQEIYHTYEFF